jgi:eukaryotic-like serine/threonine-protein kinase
MTLAPVITGRGGTWNADGVILFSMNEVSPIQRVSASGGDVTDVTTISPGQVGHLLPQFLPDGVHFLYSVFAGSISGIYLGALGGSAPVRLVNAESGGAYHRGGWLLWMRSDVLLAQRLDVTKAKLIGDPVTLAEGFDKSSPVRPCFSVSSTGWLAYRTGSTGRRQLTWVDRSGAAVSTVGDPDATYYRPRISPDGNRVAVERADQGNRDIWLLEGNRRSRLPLDNARHTYPVWSPDGKRIAYRSNRSGPGDIYQKTADGSGEEEKLVASDTLKNPTSWSRDGRFLMYFTVDSKNRADLWVLPLSGERKPRVVLNTPIAEAMGEFSPGGEWFAYESEVAGRREVFVRPFGKTGGSDSAAGWQVSTGGGMTPRWRPDGKELYFLDPVGAMMAAPISVTGNSLTLGTPVRLFPTRIVGSGLDPIASGQYDVASNGRFLINTLQESNATPITLIQNWNPDAGK